MKSNTFKYSMLAVGVIAAMSIASTTNAATSTADSTPTIDNIATATYSIGGVKQTPVESNKVTVSITQSAAFSLAAKNTDGDLADDYNTLAIVTPKGRVDFNHTLTNGGNLEDTYTLNLAQGGDVPNNLQGAGSYDFAATSVTYTIYNTDDTQKSTTTVTGTVFQNTAITLKPNERADILVSAKTSGNVGGDSQNLTLSAVSEFFTASDTTKATLSNINNSTTKVPVFKITSKVSSTLDLNDNASTVTYTVTVRNDGNASYAADANNIVVFSGLPTGLKLASTANFSVSNNATITSGNEGNGASGKDDSVRVTLLNLERGQEATIQFDVQKDEGEDLADPKDTINHVAVTLDLGEGQTIYDTTDATDSNQNTANFYPAADDSEVTDGTVSSAIGSDSAAPLVANKRAVSIVSPTNKEIPTTTTASTQVTHSSVISNTGREIEGEQAGEIKLTITSASGAKVTMVTGSAEIVYDADNDPATPNDTYTVTRDGNGDYDLSTAQPKDGAAAWTGMVPNSTVTLNYQVQSSDAIIDSTEEITVTLIVGGQDAPTTGDRNVKNETTVKGLKLLKTQALNASCDISSTLTFTTDLVAANPSDCIVYKITAFNNFSTADARFTFDNVVITDTTARFDNKAVIQSASTAYNFPVKLDDVSNSSAVPANNTYNAAASASEVGGTVTSLAPQAYAAMVFAIKINPEGTTTTTP